MVDAIHARAARRPITVARVGAAAGQAAEIVGYATKATEPIDKLAAAVKESGTGRVPKSVEALLELRGVAEFVQLGLHVTAAIASDRPAAAVIDAMFKAADIAIGATTGLAKLHPLLALLDVYCAALKASVGLLDNKAVFDRLLSERRERIAELEKLADRARTELSSSLLSAMQDAYVRGGFVNFMCRATLERAVSPGARPSQSELIDTYRAMSEAASASRIFADAKAAALAEVELRVLVVGIAAAQIEKLGRMFDAHVATLESRPAPLNQISGYGALRDRFTEESFRADGPDIDSRASDAFEGVLKRARGLVADAAAIERRFEALPAFALARRIRSQGLAPR
jgi:hypothetical protein